ncbi:hypothetical protein [uncultured Ruegeria sp.]|uniref:hypothetical protein n=1 Tax=uncultured Ruegeria sp. TaxID=259304 RepID=UPI00262E1C36|nr:hypothetical protein [uncultured Ruegeria sp.]
MLQPLSDVYSITGIAVRNDTEICVSMVLDELGLDPENPHAALYSLTPDLAAQIAFHPQAVVGMCYADSNTLIAVAESGEVFLHAGEDTRAEKIERDGGPLRNICMAGDQPVVCGANLQLMRRSPAGTWGSYDLDDRLRSDFGSIHLEAVDAYDENEIYAVGRDGMIMWFDGLVWNPVQCPTNLSFLSVCCGRDGTVYVGGQTGIVATGRHDSFTISTPEDPLNDIWGIQEFAGTVYCAMMRALMSWDAADGLQVVPGAMEDTLTFYNLEVGQSVLWSAGEEDVVRFDGKSWTRIDAVNVE